MGRLDGDIIHEGWMVKSPPQERASYGYPMIKKKWRRRWFVLQQGKLPSQYLLCYFTDNNKRRLKGTICLDECDQVDYDLKDSNGKYDFMFAIRTPKRMYFLALDSLSEMNAWVRVVCTVCGLRSTPDDENGPTAVHMTSVHSSQPVTTATTTAPASSQIQISSPYILISDCYTGTRPSPSDPNPGSNNIHFRSNSAGAGTGSTYGHRQRPKAKSLSSSMRPHVPHDDEDDNVFAEPPNYTAPPPPRGANLASSSSIEPGPDEVMISSLKIGPQSDLVVLPPDRPPKPAHLSIQQLLPAPPSSVTGFENYANSTDMQEVYETEANNNNDNMNVKSKPSVARNLKPGRKSFGSGSVTIAGCRSSDHSQFSSTLGPPVERALKPKPLSMSTMPRLTQTSFTRQGVKQRPPTFLPFNSGEASSSQDEDFSDESPSRRHSSNEEQIYYYMPSVNISSTMGGKNPPLMIPADSFEHPSISYIDLDLPRTDETDHMPSHSRHNHQSVQSAPVPKIVDNSNTIYKTIDIEKTDAFNRTKRDIEQQRQQNDSHSKNIPF